MKHYVLGFLFDREINNVILIRKNKPAWQRGRLNGVGGKIEKGEKAIDAMRREWLEETGTVFQLWQLFAVMKGPDFSVVCYAGRDEYWDERIDSVFERVHAVTKEIPERISVYEMSNRYSIIPNLRWLVPMAKDFLKNVDGLGGSPFQADITYGS